MKNLKTNKHYVKSGENNMKLAGIWSKKKLKQKRRKKLKKINLQKTFSMISNTNDKRGDNKKKSGIAY